MRSRFTGLWRHPEFMKLWIGETISVFGSAISGLALPLTAALILKATPGQMGILGAAEMAPFLLVGLFAGVWVDRLRRRPLMIAADIGRAALMFSIPILALLDVLRMEYIYVSGFLFGILTVFFDVAYQSYLPSLVEREHLVEGNGKLEISRAAAGIAGPGIAGALIQVVTAPVALIADAISFAISAVCLGLIRKPEPTPSVQSEGRSIWGEIGEGLRVVLGNRVLRSIAGCTGTFNLSSSMVAAVFVLYLTRELKLEPAVMGLIFAVGAPGAMLGAVVAAPAAKRFGLGRTIIGSSLLGGIGGIFTPLAAGSVLIAAPLLIISGFLQGCANVIYNVNQVSLRQAITPDRLLGRMNASMRFIVWGTMPIGSLIGGALGETIGLRPTLVVAAAGMLLSVFWVYFSPVRQLQEQPPSVDEAPAAAVTA